MLRTLIGMGIAVALGFVANSFDATPSFAVCNKICQDKCARATGFGAFSTVKECVEAWSRRNGPTGLGCGKPGEPWKACE